ncbi:MULTISPECIES: hypothetical protein [Flectobacillus]|uniref:hypothetical protein n=1 Tax=Flectobacillus TaxID=101 RepID=UPI000BA3DD11|nr:MULTISPECIES: hypothetical protein [Flectobacillus]MDI9870228.1 hypothetical protein [Flectobacillus roseus]PAC25237.1 hypothetical protein BWI92_26680 [Flectobacillus sp. BAB-3569]PAC25824.1 hypothetical protein BWI92_26520 [Flectobacillus sp. BAB-3569]PAC32060.1 hypothetical protein BWI92_06810 [Flectobacillus sp. BAB-3569]
MKSITTNNKLSVSKSTVAKFNNQDTLNHKTASIISNVGAQYTASIISNFNDTASIISNF